MPRLPTQVLSRFLKVRRNMIGEIQDYKLKDIKVKGNDATVTFTSRSVSAYGLQLLFVLSLWSPMTTTLTSCKQWNQADNNRCGEGKAKRSHNENSFYGENFNGDLTAI